ncbi:MAG: hypothetical protein R3B13_11660 [Polyangiaceae bacterium]
MNEGIETFAKDGLSITVSRSHTSATMRWTGMCDARDPETILGPLFRRLTQELKGLNLTIDFREFEYMNSATVSPILQFIKKLDASDTPTTLLYDCTVNWQRINCQCMRAIARTLNHLQVVDSASQ